MAKEVSEFSVPVTWGQISGKIWGPDHGRPVLCLHGWTDNCGSFSTLIPLLPKEFRYVAMDLAGHGLSSHRPPGNMYSCLEYVADLRRVTDALQLRKFSIIGHSMGADISAVFSSLYPEMVDGLVLLDSLGFPPTDLKELLGCMRKTLDQVSEFDKKTDQKFTGVYTYEKAVERLLAAIPTLSEQSVHILLERGLVQVEGGFIFSKDLRVNTKNLLRINLEQSLYMQSMVQSPILVVLAEQGHDNIYPSPAQRKFTSTLVQCFRDRNHTVVRVPGHHHIHLTNPEVVAPIVSDFLRSKVLSQSNNGKHKL